MDEGNHCRFRLPVMRERCSNRFDAGNLHKRTFGLEAIAGRSLTLGIKYDTSAQLSYSQDKGEDVSHVVILTRGQTRPRDTEKGNQERRPGPRSTEMAPVDSLSATTVSASALCTLCRCSVFHGHLTTAVALA